MGRYTEEQNTMGTYHMTRWISVGATQSRAEGGLSRRRVLALAGAAVASLTLTSCVFRMTRADELALDAALNGLAAAPMPSVQNRKPLVDPHCHIFNILDIPASEFARLVFLEDSTLSKVLTPLIELVVSLMEAFSPTLKKEMQKLPSLSGIEGGAGPGESDEPRPRDVLNKFLVEKDAEHGARKPIDGTTRTFPERLDQLPPLVPTLETLPTPANDEEKVRREYQRFLALLATDPATGRAYGEMPSDTEGGAGPETTAAAGGSGSYQTTPSVVSRGVLAGPAGGGGDEPATCKPSTAADVQNAVRWVFKLTMYRYDLLQELLSLVPTDLQPPTDVDRTRLMTPSLVDYDFWLKADPIDEPTPSSIAGQVTLMAAISKRTPENCALHCLVPFDPLRHAWQKRDPNNTFDRNALDVALDAVENFGAIGIKIYPPMGYKPDGNANESDFGKHLSPKVLKHFKDAKDLGGALDESLRELFAKCADPLKDIPVFTHCSNSQGSFAGASLRAGPEPWLTVLQKHPTLRVNLAHAGGPWCLARLNDADPDDQKICSDDHGQSLDWFEDVVNLIGQGTHPNLYLDIADFDMFMKCDSDKKLARVRDGFIRLLEKLPTHADPKKDSRGRVMQRMMYGTDWILLGRTSRAEFYFDRMRDELIEPLAKHFKRPAFVEEFFSSNALRFLGLWRETPTDKSPTWIRLEKFYEGQNRGGMLERIGL
jgi:predicted TIM-barrel fold metal-dependent hydrolase